MKRLPAIITLITICGTVSFAQQSHLPLNLQSGSLAVSISGGTFAPVKGAFNATTDITDHLNSGPTIGVALKYSISPLWTVRAAYDFAYNNFETRYRPAGKTPALVAPMVTGDVVLKFGSLMEVGSIVNPYCFTGGGAYVWKFSQDGTCGPDKGTPMQSATGTEWKGTSAEVHTGVGVEVNVVSNIAVFLEGQYRFLFSKNTDDFGDGFGNLQFVKFGGGLTYAFALAGGDR